MSHRRKYYLGTALLLAMAIAVWMKGVFAAPRRPFEYMVAGTAMTALALVAAFVVLVKRRCL